MSSLQRLLYSLKQLDRFLFGKLDLLQQNVYYQRYLSFLSTLPQETRVMVNRGTVVLIVIFPLFFLLIFSFMNGSFHDRVELKKEIATLSNKIIKYKNNSGNLRNQVIADTPLNKQSDLELKLQNILLKSNITSDKIVIEEFKSSPLDGFIEAQASISFQNLPLAALMNLFNDLTEQSIKISQLNINKNESTEYLDGSFGILHYGYEGSISSDEEGGAE